MGKIIVQRGRFSYPIIWGEDANRGMLLGRGFHCDYIIPDRFVDAEQVRLCPPTVEASVPEGALCHLQVLDQTNPVLINGSVLDGFSCWLRSGDRFTVGRTTLTVYSPMHPVREADSFVLNHWFMRHGIRTWAALCAILVLFAVALMDQSLTTYETFTWHDDALQSIFIPGMVVVWAAVWAFIGRLLRGQPLFMAHVVFACVGATASLLFWGVYDYVMFMTNLEGLAVVIDFVLFVLIFGLTLGFHLSFASSLRHTFVIGVMLAFGLAGTIGLMSLTDDKWAQAVDHNKSLKAPPIPHPSPVSVDAYISAYDALLQSLPEE
ncbi:MAG: FHA domain-containing protein [Gammaproteobacteria bacterium]